MNTEVYSKIQASTLSIFSAVSIGTIIATFFTPWMEIIRYDQTPTLTIDYLLNGISEYKDDQLVANKNYADIDALYSDLSCQSISNAVLGLGIVSILFHAVMLALNGWIYFKQINLLRKKLNLLVTGVVLFLLALIGLSTGYGLFKGNHCLGKIADNFQSAPLVTVKTTDAWSYSLTIWPICLTAAACFFYIELIVKYIRSNAHQQGHAFDSEQLIH
jgi:hypothetical protein